jgi:hypothetical protein
VRAATHVAFDFRVVRDNLAGKARTTRDRLVPYCAFIDPELGRVGLGETDARRLGIEVRVAKLPMTSVLRARAIGETRGFLKALIDARSDRILGTDDDRGELRCHKVLLRFESPHQFSSNATVPWPPSAQMLTIARLPLGMAASSFTAWLRMRAPVAAPHRRSGESYYQR